MLITELLLVISSVTVVDTTRPPIADKLPTLIKKDSVVKKDNSSKPDPKGKVDKGTLLNKVRRGGWDGN